MPDFKGKRAVNLCYSAFPFFYFQIYIQSYLAQNPLSLQLQSTGELTPTECISMFNEDYDKFRASM